MYAEKLADVLAVDDDALRDSRPRLETPTALAGEPTIAYRFVDSPIGKLLVASTVKGVVRIAFENENEDDVLQELSDQLSPAILESRAKLDHVATEIDEYFAGKRKEFEFTIDLSLSRGFRKKVLLEMAEIPFGETSTYRNLAEEAGNANATRAVGSACATNPIPIILPCHRVLRSDGSLGGYRGGLAAKRFLLDFEDSVKNR